MKTLEEMYEEERKLPALYITADSGKRITEAGDAGVFVDDMTGEIAWPALECQNPDCPGRGANGEPFLFVAPDPAVVVKDGELTSDRSRATVNDNYHGNCPKCREIRNLDAESSADRLRYANYVKPHVLPETERGRKQLAAERKKREEELAERMQRKVDN